MLPRKLCISNDKRIFFAGQTAGFLWSASRRVMVCRARIVIRGFGPGKKRIQRFQPEHLGCKNAAKVAGHLLRQIIERGQLAATAEMALRHFLL